MRKSLLYNLALLSICFMVARCNKILDVERLDQITGEAIWKDSSLMQAYVNNLYSALGSGEYNSTSGMSVITDQAIWTNGAKAVVQSTVTASNMDILGGSRFSYLNWGTLYAAIRKCNEFLVNSAESPEVDAPSVQRMRGEAYFLRGYYYHNLLRNYGGVPLISKVYGLKDSTAIKRNTFKETVDYIISDADSAAALLPLKYSADNLGRATKGAALALKSRVLLYAASDLYNLNPSKRAEVGYMDEGAGRQARWQAAKDAADAVMKLGVYQLYGADPAPGDSTAKNYSDLFLDKQSPETIFCRLFSASNGAPNVGLWFSPNGYGGYGENSPIQQMVDSYEMKDGTKFSWDNPAEAKNPYANRDPRFYATVFYDGAHWKPRYADGVAYDPVGIIQAFTTLTLPNGKTLPGIDTRNGPIENWNGSLSNYYLRKFLDPNNDHKSIAQEVPWIFFRYGEILLNYAEACIGLGQYAEARDALNKIRRRAGMPEFTATLNGTALRDEYRNERKIEMAFEHQRFYDMRRWMIAPKVMNEPAKGIKITVQGTDRANRSTYHDYKYQVFDIQERHWDDKMYFLAIPYEETQKNKLLVQNPNW